MALPVKFVDVRVDEDAEKPRLGFLQGAQTLVMPERPQTGFLNQVFRSFARPSHQSHGEGEQAVKVSNQSLLKVWWNRLRRWFLLPTLGRLPAPNNLKSPFHVTPSLGKTNILSDFFPKRKNFLQPEKRT
jgi:hypothetical protein